MRTRKIGKLALIMLLVFSMAVGSVSPTFAMESGPLDTETEPMWQEVEEALISAVGNTDAEIQSSKTYRKTELVDKRISDFIDLEYKEKPNDDDNVYWVNAILAWVSMIPPASMPASVTALVYNIHEFIKGKYEFFNVDGKLQITWSTYKSYDVKYRTGKKTLIDTYTVVTFDIYTQRNFGPYVKSKTDSRTFRHK